MEYKIRIYTDFDGLNIEINGPRIEYNRSDFGHGINASGLEMTDKDKDVMLCCDNIADNLIKMLKARGLIDHIKRGGLYAE